ncbi:phytanoyl-CoA dioxygenase family protein [Amycolatopsis sp. cmx-4-68]|uniref:phytanoyl-CoA dioxygenase family protein n=1 Tax=Amycolatopsis sp. cmx-4-68 TaxID=2790938 RepID=UPI003979AEF5
MTEAGVLTPDQTDDYHKSGFLFQRSVFSEAEVDSLNAAAEEELGADTPWRTVEEATGRPCRVHGSHLRHEVFERLVRLPRLLRVAEHLLGDRVYVHQFKINEKHAYGGGAWHWHQDFIFWNRQDGMPEPRALTVGIFLDDVTEFNGPLMFVPGGHLGGVIDLAPKRGGWADTLTSDLKYSLQDSDVLTELARRNGITTPKGPRGSAVWFHCTLPHGSAQNLSPFGRRMLFVSYNAVANALPAPSPRPEWLVSRTFDPLVAGDGPLAGA